MAGNVCPQNGPHPTANLFHLELTERFSPVAEVGNGTQRAMNLPGYRWVVLGLLLALLPEWVRTHLPTPRVGPISPSR